MLDFNFTGVLFGLRQIVRCLEASHVSALPPKALSSLIAISGEIPAFRDKVIQSLARYPESFRRFSYGDPRGSMQSARTDSPGCGGFFMGILFSS